MVWRMASRDLRLCEWGCILSYSQEYSNNVRTIKNFQVQELKFIIGKTYTSKKCTPAFIGKAFSYDRKAFVEIFPLKLADLTVYNIEVVYSVWVTCKSKRWSCSIPAGLVLGNAGAGEFHRYVSITRPWNVSPDSFLWERKRHAPEHGHWIYKSHPDNVPNTIIYANSDDRASIVKKKSKLQL